MDERIRTRGAYISSIILSCSAIGALILGTSMIASYPDEIWWIGLILIFCFLVLTISVVSILRNTKKEKTISDTEMAIISEKKPGVDNDLSNSNAIKVEVLASWLYTVKEWKQFMQWETKERRRSTLIETIVLILLGTFFLYYFKSNHWLTAFAISLFVGITYGLLKYSLMLSSIRLKENKIPEVTITNHSIIVNGHMNRFYGNNLWLGTVSIKETKQFNVLEISYCWSTRNQKASDEIRVPIPKGSLKEAIYLQEKLMATKNQWKNLLKTSSN